MTDTTPEAADQYAADLEERYIGGDATITAEQVEDAQKESRLARLRSRAAAAKAHRDERKSLERDFDTFVNKYEAVSADSGEWDKRAVAAVAKFEAGAQELWQLAEEYTADRSRYISGRENWASKGFTIDAPPIRNLLDAPSSMSGDGAAALFLKHPIFAHIFLGAIGEVVAPSRYSTPAIVQRWNDQQATETQRQADGARQAHRYRELMAEKHCVVASGNEGKIAAFESEHGDIAARYAKGEL